ncbi:hypothetical protein BDF14DRAFT_1882078 [Spinellus fusiger]|nr:hypothetical protein BDF14DRAFT_1882078 [Spinellus fusiger]
MDHLKPEKKSPRMTLGRNAISMTNLRTPPSLRSMARLGSSFSSLTTANSPGGDGDTDLLKDILNVRRALDLFLDSRIPQAEAILVPRNKTSMYYSLGHSFILFLKSMMTFQQTDIQTALDAIKHTLQLSNAQRKKDGSWIAWVKGNSVQDIKDMTSLHRHAELIYAEAYLLKALLSVLHDESLVSFLREGLHIRNSYNTYKILEKYIEFAKKEEAEGKDISAYGLDDHFTSGVALGIGCFDIVLSLLPATVLKLAEFIGFTSDRSHGVAMLASVGGWCEMEKDTPHLSLHPTAEEGLRRQFCDMVFITYHIIISKIIPLTDIDIGLAERVLSYNLTLYPKGVFFLFFSGRLQVGKRHLETAKEQYQKAIHTQKDWKQLQHMCYWEVGLIHFLQHQWEDSAKIHAMLCVESNWSKAVYTYLQAVGLYLSGEQSTKDEETQHKVDQMMKSVNGARQKIAGKSIPLEKFVARKARQFTQQNNRLVLPDLEILSALGVLDCMPQQWIQLNLDRINALAKNPLEADDLCLVHYLKATLVRLWVVSLSHEDPMYSSLCEEHHQSITIVLQNAPNVVMDHYIYYFTRYENARMMILQGQYESAHEEIQSIIRTSDKKSYSIGTGSHAKNKYSLENVLLFKCHNCRAEIEVLSKQEALETRWVYLCREQPYDSFDSVSVETDFFLQPMIMSPRLLETAPKSPAYPQAMFSSAVADSMAVTAVLLRVTSDPQCIHTLLLHLLKYSFIKEIYIYNLLPFQPLQLQVLEAEEEMGSMARFITCALASYEYCYLQDDAWMNPWMDSAYTNFLFAPHLVHAMSSPGVYFDHVQWQFENKDLHLHTGYAMLSTGAFVPRWKAQHFLTQLGKSGMGTADLLKADEYFSVWTNQYPWLLENPLVMLDPLAAKVDRDTLQTDLYDAMRRMRHVLQKDTSLDPKDYFERIHASPVPSARDTRQVFGTVVVVCLFTTNMVPFPRPDALVFTKANVPSLQFMDVYYQGERFNLSLRDGWESSAYHRAVDGDAHTCWNTHKAPRAGDYFGLVMVGSLEVHQLTVVSNTLMKKPETLFRVSVKEAVEPTAAEVSAWVECQTVLQPSLSMRVVLQLDCPGINRVNALRVAFEKAQSQPFELCGLGLDNFSV